MPSQLFRTAFCGAKKKRTDAWFNVSGKKGKLKMNADYILIAAKTMYDKAEREAGAGMPSAAVSYSRKEQ